MKTSNIHYSKVFSLGNYENEKIGVDIEVQEGDDIQKVIQQARQFVEFNHQLNGIQSDIEQCDRVINNPDDFTGSQLRSAYARRSELQEKIRNGVNLLAQ